MYFLVALSLILGANALSPRSCSFGLTASGGQPGTIGQLSDGQNRVGGGLTPATFTIDNGSITDAAGRGCILTESIEQFQCDEGKIPTSGFAIDSNGTLTSSGSSVFYACPASETEWNLYTTPVEGQKKCVEISLTASGCGASASVAPSVSTVTVTVDNCAMPSTTLVASTFVQSWTYAASVSSAPVETQPATVSTPQTVETTVPVIPTPVSSESQTQQTSAISTEILPTESVPQQTIKTSIISTEVPWTTSTVFVSTVYTVTSCAPTVTDCPGRIGSVTTETISSYTTVCPVSETQAAWTSAPATQIIMTSKPVNTWISSPPTTLKTKTKSTWTQLWSNTTTSVLASAASSTAPSSTCVPTVLSGSSTSGNYQYPHLIVPVNSSSTTTAYGTQYFGDISPSISTLFNFDIPASYAGHTCSLIFLLPLQSQLETSSYTFSGSGTVDVAQLSSVATQSTTSDTAPSVEKDLGTFTLTEGSSTLVQSFACPAGEAVSYEMSAVGDTDLYYFQDWNPSPLGLYITYC